jgi:hypothetical protein
MSGSPETLGFLGFAWLCALVFATTYAFSLLFFRQLREPSDGDDSDEEREAS